MSGDKDPDSWSFYDRCPHCKKPARSPSNLRRLRTLVVGGTLSCGLMGAAALPFLGFGLGGITAGSFAASWQSSIGLVAAGSLFATLQSLGATGVGILLFGSTSAALGLLATIATKLGWCECNLENNNAIVEGNEKRVEHDIENSLNECPDCNQPMICVSNLQKVRKMILETRLSAADSPWNVLESLEADQREIFLSGDLTSAMHILASLANNSIWKWCMRSPIMEALTVSNNTNETENILMNEVNYKECRPKDNKN